MRRLPHFVFLCFCIFRKSSKGNYFAIPAIQRVVRGFLCYAGNVQGKLSRFQNLLLVVDRVFAVLLYVRTRRFSLHAQPVQAYIKKRPGGLQHTNEPATIL